MFLPPGPSTPRMRASDAERAATVRLLQDGVARGQLTFEEGDERMAAAFAAVHRDELPPLTADLPPAAPTAPGWRALAESTVLQVRSSLASGALSPSSLRSRPAVALGVLFAVLVLLTVIVAATTAGGGFHEGFHQGFHEHWHD